MKELVPRTIFWFNPKHHLISDIVAVLLGTAAMFMYMQEVSCSIGKSVPFGQLYCWQLHLAFIIAAYFAARISYFIVEWDLSAKRRIPYSRFILMEETEETTVLKNLFRKKKLRI